PAAFSGLCRVKTGGLALHFELESAHQGNNTGWQVLKSNNDVTPDMPIMLQAEARHSPLRSRGRQWQENRMMQAIVMPRRVVAPGE
ncbi:hypothetical protein, partial [Erwinia sp. V71]|uniref:hypothetical protein n=1 Tax=Erwinia sp. V71 TaxID=3369424 RepID=UPI003F5E6EA3